MSDLISREDAINALVEKGQSSKRYKLGEFWELNLLEIKEALDALPSAEPEPEEFEWCTDCKEYDQEKHCCHRWTKVIRQTVEEMKSAEPERKKGKWIYDTERVAGDGWTYRQYHCSECKFQELGGLANFCPNCGADMRGEHGKA